MHHRGPRRRINQRPSVSIHRHSSVVNQGKVARISCLTDAPKGKLPITYQIFRTTSPLSLEIPTVSTQTTSCSRSCPAAKWIHMPHADLLLVATAFWRFHQKIFDDDNDYSHYTLFILPNSAKFGSCGSQLRIILPEARPAITSSNGPKYLCNTGYRKPKFADPPSRSRHGIGGG